MNKPDTEDLGSGRKSFHAKWLSYKRKRFWAIFLVLLYSLSGFFGVPVLVNKLVVDKVRADMGREASFVKIQFNPYVLSLKVNGFQLNDTDGVKLTGFDELFINFQLSSLFKWAWTFREVRLDGFYLQLERFAPDDTRLSRLMGDAAASAPPAEQKETDTGVLPRLLIQDLSLTGGTMEFRDHVPESLVELKVGPVNVAIQELNTLPDRYGQQSVIITLPGGATLGWQGNISLAPLESEGELTIENSHLDPAIAYLEAILPLESIAASLSMRTHYQLNALAEGAIDIKLDGLELDLVDVAVTGLTPSTEFLVLPSLSLRGGTLRYPENELNFSHVRMTNPVFSTWLDEDGRLSLLDLVPKPGNSESRDTIPKPNAQGWKLGIDEFALEGGHVAFIDQSISPPGRLSMSGLQVTASRIGNEAGRSIPVRLDGVLDAGGDFNFEGELIAFPKFSLSGRANLRDIPLALGQPYVEQKLSMLIENGKLSSQSELTMEADETFKLTGALGIAGLKVQDSNENNALVGWEQLEIDRFELDIPAKNLQLSRVLFKQPYGRFVVNEDRSTNLGSLVNAEAPANAQAAGQSDPGWSVVVGGIGVNDGSMDFADFSLPLKFATRISDLDGTVSTIDSASSEPANIRLEGQVDEYGMARIEGSMSVFDPIWHTDITVEFRNLLMSSLSPYTAQFAGREIDQGKLDLELGYFIDKGQLQGQNSIVLRDLVLGAEVDNPDATSLPLGLAVALLKDSNGVIDIDLPVEGNINDPEFQISGVVMQAISVLITKIVSAPFRLLGALIGIDSEDLGQFQFLAGRSDLTPPELEKITQLRQALQQRPELSIEISGPFDPVIDVPKLQYFRLRDIVMSRMGKEVAEQDEEIEMLDEEIRSILESLFSERFPNTSLATLKATHVAPPPGDPEGKAVLDALSYSADLRDRLLASEVIGSADLENLANARALSIRAAFLASGEYSEERIVIAEPAENTSEDAEWVVTELGVSSR